MHKPRGVVTTRHDPEGRPTVYELIAGAGDGLAPAGRLDMASTGLLVCTNDTQLAAWLTDPRSGVEREYAVTVRGRMSAADAARFVDGVTIDGQRLPGRRGRDPQGVGPRDPPARHPDRGPQPRDPPAVREPSATR